MNFKGKVALITGSSRGIGKACAIDLAQQGCNIIINFNKNEEKANETAQYIKNNFTVETFLVKCDISDEKKVQEMINKIIERFNKIDILVNNASIEMDSLVQDKTQEKFSRLLNVNLIGTFLVSKYTSQYMLNQKYGKIVNISSTNGIDTYYPESLDYDASKAGVISLTHNLAKEYAPYINVNTVAPGWVNTDMNKELDSNFINKETKKIFIGRFAEPKEIAKVVTFLSSDDASYINGSIIRVDGGY